MDALGATLAGAAGVDGGVVGSADCSVSWLEQPATMTVRAAAQSKERMGTMIACCLVKGPTRQSGQVPVEDGSSHWPMGSSIRGILVGVL